MFYMYSKLICLIYFFRGIRYIDLREPAPYVEMETETDAPPNEMTNMNDGVGSQHHGTLQHNQEPARNGSVTGHRSEAAHSRIVNAPVDL